MLAIGPPRLPRAARALANLLQTRHLSGRVDTLPARMAVPERQHRFRREAPNRAATTPKRPQPERGPGTPVIEFRGVSKVYAGGDVALDQATFSIDPGEFAFLVGHTGSGKSTVM